jgi:twitching motility protein PilT
MRMNMEEILLEAGRRRASDVHMTVGVPVMYRVRGELQLGHGEPLTAAMTEEGVRQLMTPEQLQHFMNRRESDFSFELGGVSRYRVNAYRQKGSVGMAIRLIPATVPRLEELGLPPIVKELAQRPQGLVLVTGPTGSGKSTTLAAMIDHINRRRKGHIITLEDPIEFVHGHKSCVVNQREIGADTESFSVALRAALRQDPDVILVGEMRDLETILTAVTAAETGHLVFGTLHTADAPQTVHRIIDMFPPESQSQIRAQLSAVLLGVLAQRLLPTADGQGRVAAMETLVNTPAVASLIRSDKVHQIRSVMQTGRVQGMQTFDLALRELVQQQVITTEAAKEAVFGFGE